MKKKIVKHNMSEKIVSSNIDKNWHYDTDTNKFTHPIYKGMEFNPLSINQNHVIEMVRTDKFGKKTIEKQTKVVSTLYPYIPSDEDPRNLGFTLNSNHTTNHFEAVPNKMETFWDTRRGKRYIKYISYRKSRDANKKSWLETQPEMKPNIKNN